MLSTAWRRERNRFWGLHRDVDFDELRRLADELLETVRRRAMSSHAATRKKARV